MLELTAAILLTEPAVAREVHAAFRYFTVDEFQDVNPLQKLLLDAWLGGREELCVVGDPRQTIYSFTGATSEYLRSFAADYPRRRWSGWFATTARRRRWWRRRTGWPAATGRRPTRAGGAAGTRARAGGDAVPRRGGGGGRAWPPRSAALTGQGVPPQEIAVLLRINAHMERFERALAEAKLPYVVRGAERFYERPEVRQALVLLRGAARAAGAGTDATGLPGELPAAVRHVLASAGLTAAPPAARGAVRERWESLAAIAGLADTWPPRGRGDPGRVRRRARRARGDRARARRGGGDPGHDARGQGP